MTNDNAHDFECLAGIRIVDFTQFEAGTSCTEALAWLGADVVKIENPKTGDPGRRLRPGKPDDDPFYFHMFNANKKSLAINLKTPRGLELVRELLKKADVTVENMAPGTIERLGLGYNEVKKLNPRIIFCQIQGFGTGSKYESGLAFDMIAQAAGAVFDTMELQNDPSFEKRGIMQVMQHANGPFKMPTWPVRVDGETVRIKPSPRLGEHSAEVLSSWLGVGAEEIAALKKDGVL